MNKNEVTVVIPIYKTELLDFEIKSLNQCVKILGHHSIVFVQPESLDASSINFEGRISSEKFPDHYFKSVFGYNRLMLTDSFYERFVHSKYILIYQLDAYVFKDELLYWCSKDYDYIGAPWIASPDKGIKKLLSLFDSKKKKERSKIFYKVGNGGFSLRKVSSHIANSKKMKSLKEILCKFIFSPCQYTHRQYDVNFTLFLKLVSKNPIQSNKGINILQLKFTGK